MTDDDFRSWSSLSDLQQEVSDCLGSNGTDADAERVARYLWLEVCQHNGRAQIRESAWAALDLWKLALESEVLT